MDIAAYAHYSHQEYIMHMYDLCSVGIVIVSALCFIQLLMQTYFAKF